MIMNDTTVILTREIFKDDESNKEEMTRSDDTWVLLLVVSVLSTLLCVIVIIFCLWACSKFCLNLSFLKTRLRCYPNCKSGFPANPGEIFDMEDIGGKIAEMQTSKLNTSYKPGASVHLGYKPGSRNISLPILPTPRSWTPSPPFPQTSHNQKFNSNSHSSCHNCCKNHCRHCLTHHECYRAYEDASHCQICTHEPTRKLANFQKYCKDIQTPKRTRTEMARSKSAYHLPVNLLTTVNSSVLQSCHDTSHSISSKKEEEASNNNYLNRSFTNSVSSKPRSSLGTERNKNEIDSTCVMNSRKSSNFIPLVFEDRGNSESIKNLAKDTREHVSMASGLFPEEMNANNNNPSFKKKLKKSLSNKRYQPKRLGEISSRRPSTPMAVAQETASSESSDVASALNRSSATYWKLYHTKEPNIDHTKDFGEEDSKYDAAEPSMSWDHLTPDPLPSTNNVEAKAEVDPSKETAVFYHEKMEDQNDKEDGNIPNPKISVS